MSFFSKVKNWVGDKFGEEKKGRKGIPTVRQDVHWRREVNDKGLEGEEAKKIYLPDEQREVPYSKFYSKARKQVFKAPIFDKTDGKNKPEPKVWDEVQPGKLEWEEK